MNITLSTYPTKELIILLGNPKNFLKNIPNTFLASLEQLEQTYAWLMIEDKTFGAVCWKESDSLLEIRKKIRGLKFPKNIHPKSLTLIMDKDTTLEKSISHMIDFFQSLYSVKEPFPIRELELIGENEQLLVAAQKAWNIFQAQKLSMDMVNLSVDKKSPQLLVDWVMQQLSDFEITLKKEGDLKKFGMNALLAVGRARKNSTFLLEIHYRPEQSTKKVVLIGKTLCFDTGGISIKPSENMHFMKSDLGGGALVVGLMHWLQLSKLPLEVIGILPVTINLVGESSLLPGEVIKAYNQKTIEVIDTDAEGRLTLADALSYAEVTHTPDLIFDFATLTGSAVRTFGSACAAIFSPNQKLLEQMQKYGDKVGERVWALPLWEEYLDNLKSDVADIKNYSGKPVSGAIDAAVFLKTFLNDPDKWIHFDIAGVAFGSTHYANDKAATGWGVQLMTEVLSQISLNS